MKQINKKMMFAAWTCHNKNYFAYQTWHNPLKNIFKHFFTFDPQECLYRYGKDEMNRKFLEIVEKEQPDYIFLWLIYEEFYLETLFKIKEISPKTKLINFFGDDDVLFENYTRYLSLFIDYPLASHKNYFKCYEKDGIRNVFLSCGVDNKRYRNLRLEKKYDVSFIGIPKRDRVDFIKYLIETGIYVKIYGSGWENYHELKDFYGGHLSNEDSVKVINESKINLSFTKNYEGITGFKARVFEICCCKSFLLSEYFEGYLDFLKENKEIVMFKTKEELLKKINYYLKNEKEREKIASRAYEKVRNNYSQDKEFSKIFSKIEKLNVSNKKEFPKIKDKALYLTSEDLKLSDEEIKNKVVKADYIGFRNKKNIYSAYKDFFQIYSLKKTKKDISCCDYYVSSKMLGDYLILNAGYAFKQLSKEDFSKLLLSDQLLLKKSFFLKNIQIFKQFEEKKQDLFNKDEIAFVSIPLIRTKLFKNISNENMEKVFQPQFENKLRQLNSSKHLFSDSYVYKLIFFSLFNRPYIISRLIKRFYSKTDIISKYFVKTA